MNEYIIVNKTSIQKRIEDLKKEVEFYDKVGALSINPNRAKAEVELSLLQQFMSQSTPLIPEIEKAINSSIRSFESNAYEMPELIEEIQQDYISNLKLNI